MRRLYSIAYALALTALLPREYAKRPVELKRVWLREKRGYPSIAASGPGQKTLWIHAVSVGEVIASVAFVKAFKSRHPDFRIVVSTITDTGRAVALERLASLAEHVYLPFDLMGPLRRAIAHIKPTVFAVMETELWPNMYRALAEAGVPTAIMNGRISDKSFARYMRVRPILKPLLDEIGVFCMQDKRYAERIIAMGAEPSRVHVIGNFKFDLALTPKPTPWALGLTRPVIVVGSTHKGEERIIGSAYRKVLSAIPGASMIIAPRHPNRADEAEAALRAEGIACIRRSAISEGETPSGVIMLDTVGELSSVYREADATVMGGSFIPHGGQNPLEPAYWGKPVIAGPHMENFPFVRELEAEGAVIRTDAAGLSDVIIGLLNDPAHSAEMGRKGRAFIDSSRGAVSAAIILVEAMIP